MIGTMNHTQGHLSDARPTRGPKGTFLPSRPAPDVPETPSEPARNRTESHADAGAALAATIRAIAGGVNPAAFDSMREDIAKLQESVGALANREPTTVRFAIGTGEPGPVLQNVRPEVPTIVESISWGFRNLWLSGPAGTGKTTIARTVADGLGRRFASQSFAPDITSAALVGGPDIQGVYREPAFVDFYESGGVYLLDEIDAADPGILLVLNQALDNGHLPLPRHTDPARRMLKKHPEFVCICAANTWGTGADAQFVGRLQQDAAFLDRFAGAMFAIGYDKDLERSILADESLLEMLWDIRAKVESNKIRRTFGTRQVVAAAKMKSGGATTGTILARLTTNWTRQEREKVEL